MKHNKI